MGPAATKIRNLGERGKNAATGPQGSCRTPGHKQGSGVDLPLKGPGCILLHFRLCQLSGAPLLSPFFPQSTADPLGQSPACPHPPAHGHPAHDTLHGFFPLFPKSLLPCLPPWTFEPRAWPCSFGRTAGGTEVQKVRHRQLDSPADGRIAGRMDGRWTGRRVIDKNQAKGNSAPLVGEGMAEALKGLG